MKSASDSIALGFSGFRETLEELAKSSIQNSKALAAQNLEAQLTSLYALAVHRAKQEDDIDKIAQIWEIMEGISDAFARQLRTPNAGVGLDTVLDIRAKCCELKENYIYIRVAAAVRRL